MVKKLFRQQKAKLIVIIACLLGLSSYWIIRSNTHDANKEYVAIETAKEKTSGAAAVGNEKQSDASRFSIGNLVDETNKQRSNNSLPPLTNNQKLNLSAKAKCDDMVIKNYWSHFGPDGTKPWVFITNAGYSYSTAGENLAYGFYDSASVVVGWMNSPEHKKNIVNPAFTEVGFGICESNNFNNRGHHIVVVQHFASPILASEPKKVTPKPYVASVCKKTPIPYKTITKEANYMEVGQTDSYGGFDGYTETCTPDSTGYKPPDITINPIDKTVLIGTKQPLSP